MTRDIPQHAQSLTTSYRPVAAYFEDADSVEYVRRDVPAVYSRVDPFLTLIYDMRRRDELIGFRLKGFKNFYLQHLQAMGDFVSMVGALERGVSAAADGMFDQEERRAAYAKARRIALDDSVELTDLPQLRA